MQHPTPPPAEPLPDTPQFSLSDARRRQINDRLGVAQTGLAVAVNHPPGHRKPHLTIVKLPRGSSGKTPRRGVHIPLPAHMQRGAVKVSKHARQRCRGGKFGNKGKATIGRKLEMLNTSRVEALILAVKRAAKKFGRCCIGRTDKAWICFSEAYRRARQFGGFERLQSEGRA